VQFYDDKSSVAASRVYRIRLLGTGNGTAPTVDLGQGITCTWIATGRVTLTWRDNPGTFIGFAGADFRDTTQANVKGYTASAGLYPATASTFTLEVDFWNAAQAAVDLATTNYLDLSFAFSELKNP
jgi:hypothetical protein